MSVRAGTCVGCDIAETAGMEPHLLLGQRPSCEGRHIIRISSGCTSAFVSLLIEDVMMCVYPAQVS